MRKHETSDILEKKLNKLKIKDRKSYEKIGKTIIKILETENIAHYKNLRYPLSDCKRVQIGHFVLIFQVEGELVRFMDYDHHDNIYKKDYPNL